MRVIGWATRLTDIHDAMGNHTHMDYNGNGGVWLSAITFPSGYVESYTWDSGFPIIRSKLDRNGNTINYNYDFQNRVWQKNYPGGTTTQFDYDAADRLSQVTDPTGTYTFTYDNMNRLTQATSDYSFDSAGALSVQYGYDKASNRTSMTDPQSLNTAYTYDVLNRLSTLAFNGQTPAFGFGYDALSRRTSLTRPNSVNATYAYDPQSRLTSILHKLGTTTLDGATYSYDNAGNRKTRTDKRLNTTLTYTYDNIYQLQLAKQGTTTKETYTYDGVGNRLSSLGVSPYQYNSSNELTSLPNVGYTYDNNGSTKTKTDPSGITTYTWDFENRLSSVALPGSGGTVSFKYDPFGRRIQKSGPSGTVNYLYDGANAIEEVDGSGNVLARYTHEPRWDGPLSMLRGSVTSYYEQDGLNSVASLTNSSGAIAQSYTYDSYGKITASTGTLTNPFQFTGREFDPETGIYYYRARYYDQGSGRFLSEDPKQFAGGSADFYDYVSNNPVNMRDPEGQSPVWGWWCGPNWTGGTFAPYDPSRAGQYHKPWGDTDTACLHHDICYYECRGDHPCSKGDRANCMRNCDAKLLSDAPYSFIGNVVSTAVWDFNKKPDTGDDAPNCSGCKSSSSTPPPPQKPCHGWGCVDNR